MSAQPALGAAALLPGALPTHLCTQEAVAAGLLSFHRTSRTVASMIVLLLGAFHPSRYPAVCRRGSVRAKPIISRQRRSNVEGRRASDTKLFVIDAAHSPLHPLQTIGTITRTSGQAVASRHARKGPSGARPSVPSQPRVPAVVCTPSAVPLYTRTRTPAWGAGSGRGQAGQHVCMGLQRINQLASCMQAARKALWPAACYGRLAGWPACNPAPQHEPGRRHSPPHRRLPALCRQAQATSGLTQASTARPLRRTPATRGPPPRAARGAGAGGRKRRGVGLLGAQ